jgi:arylsulfatase A-like enzyme
VAERVKMNLESLTANPDKVVDPILTGDRIGLSEIVGKEVRRRKKVLKPTFLDFKFRAQILRYCGAIFNRSTSRDSGKNTFALALDRVLHGQSNLLMRYPSGGYVLEAFKRWHGKHKEGKPFYSYIKLLDAHELNLYSHDLNQQKDEQKQEYEIFKKCLRSLCSEKNYKGNLLYDCSIRYVDHVLHRLGDYLKKANILKDTILVITADHGGTYPNIPVRGKKSHRVNAFYDELYRIPLVFSGEGLEAKSSQSLVSSVDIGSTLLHLIGESNPPSFRGRSLLSDVERSYVMSENQGRGPCDLIRKSVRVCIRSKKIKLVYEKPPGETEEGFVDQLYDLRNDPDEMVNLKSDAVALSDSEDLLKVARARTEEIVS